MNKETVYSLITFADYLTIRYKEQYREDISILKMNKVLYFCFAYYGAYARAGKNNKENTELEISEDVKEYLFNVEFKAGIYGPYIEILPQYQNRYLIQGTCIEDIYTSEVLKYLDPLIRDLFKANEFDLMDISKKDEEYQRAKNNNYGIMNNENIIDEYCKKDF
ncbi:MAG: hypothetical protein HXM14_02950 [Fusobacterium periodonticum]|jgi:hypothetical protein|nr:hypothetical protein [Fusobacterium periodonticum]